MENVNRCPKSIVYEAFLETFYEKRKKKKKFVLTVFYISHENDVKTFLKWFINNYFRALVNKAHLL